MNRTLVTIVLGVLAGCVADAQGTGIVGPLTGADGVEDTGPGDAAEEAIGLAFARSADDENVPAEAGQAFLVVVPLAMSRELAVLARVNGQVRPGVAVQFTLGGEGLFELDATEAQTDEDGIASVHARRVGCDGITEAQACVAGQEPPACLTFRLQAIDGCTKGS